MGVLAARDLETGNLKSEVLGARFEAQLAVAFVDKARAATERLQK